MPFQHRWVLRKKKYASRIMTVMILTCWGKLSCTSRWRRLRSWLLKIPWSGSRPMRLTTRRSPWCRPHPLTRKTSNNTSPSVNKSNTVLVPWFPNARWPRARRSRSTCNSKNCSASMNKRWATFYQGMTNRLQNPHLPTHRYRRHDHGLWWEITMRIWGILLVLRSRR